MAALYTVTNGTLSDQQDINQIINMWTGADTTNVALNGAGIAVSGLQVPASGKHVELTYDTTNNIGYVASYNRTGVAYTALVLRGLFLAMDVGGLYVGTNHTTNPGVGNLRVESALTVGTTSTFGNTITVSAGGVAVTGASSFSTNVSISGTLTVTAISLSGSLTIAADAIFGTSAHGRFFGAGGLFVGIAPSDPGANNIQVASDIIVGSTVHGRFYGGGGLYVGTTPSDPGSGALQIANTTTFGSTPHGQFFGGGGLYVGVSPSDPGSGNIQAAGDHIFGSTSHGQFYGAGGLYVGTTPFDPGSGNMRTRGSVTADTGFLMSGGTGGYSITDTSNLPWSSSSATSVTTTRVNNVVSDFFPASGPSLGTAIMGYIKMHHNVRGDVWIPYMQ